jgi:hypothetical protein
MQGRPQEFLTVGPALVADVLARFGRVRFRARGTSMRPTIQSGDILDVQRCASDELRAGDIVLVDGPGGLRAHRMLSRRDVDERAVVVTRGDAHWRRDPASDLAGVLGRVVRVTRAESSSAVSLDCTLRDRLEGLALNESARIARSVRRALRRVALAVAFSDR